MTLDPTWQRRVKMAVESYQEGQRPGKKYQPSSRVVVDLVKAQLRPGHQCLKDDVLVRGVEAMMRKSIFSFDNPAPPPPPPAVKPTEDDDPVGGNEPSKKRVKLAAMKRETAYAEHETIMVCSKFPVVGLEQLKGFSRLNQKFLPQLYAFCLGSSLTQALCPKARISQCLMIVGPKGAGKSTLARSLAGSVPLQLRSSFKFIEINSWAFNQFSKPEDGIKVLGDLIERSHPCICLIDDIDLLLSPSNGSQNNGRVQKADDKTNQYVRNAFIRLFRQEIERHRMRQVLFIATAESIDRIDSCFFSADSFSKSSVVLIPTLDEIGRREVLEQVIADCQLSLSDDVSTALLAHQTAGCVVEDLHQLLLDAMGCAKARNCDFLLTQVESLSHAISVTKDDDIVAEIIDSDSIKSVPTIDVELSKSGSTVESSTPENALDIHMKDSDQEQICSEEVTEQITFQVTDADFKEAWTQLEPRLLKEGFTSIPETTMANVGGLHRQRELVEQKIIRRFKDASLLQELGLGDPSGILLWGPPGCGKTLLAKAIANACDAKFIYLRGAEFLNKYVGESEMQVRKTFERARLSAPCLIFFDEFDAICPNRECEASHEVSKRVVNALLLEMDGVQKRTGVFVIAATNRPNLLDPAMLRSGRLEHLVFVPPPDRESRLEILECLARSTSRMGVESDVLSRVADVTDGFSGADLNKIFKNAAEEAFRLWESGFTTRAELEDELRTGSRIPVPFERFELILKTTAPTITDKQLKSFDAMREEYDRLSMS